MSFPLLSSDTANTPQFQGKQENFKERWESPFPEESRRLGGNAYSSRKGNVCLNFIRLTTSLLLTLNAERRRRQTITVYSSGHALRERTIFLSSISFERIQTHIFYKTFQEFEFAGETLAGGKGEQTNKTPRTYVKFKLLFIVNVYWWAVLWFPTEYDGLSGAHALRRVKLTTC